MIEFQTIGSDPEFALRRGNINIPAYNYFTGTKQHPEDKGNGFALLKDNLLIEGNIPPSKNMGEFYENMRFLQNLISSIVSVDGAIIYYQDIVKYNKRFIVTNDGQEFGCSSYNDAWSGETKPSPDLGNSLFRPVGAHIHIGYKMLRDDIDPMQMNEWLAKAFDYFLSLPSDTIHFTKQRRENYGAYGSYRDTSYGMEARALGGFFLQPQYLEWIYIQAIKVVEFCKSIENCEKLHNLTEASYDNYEFLGIDLLEQIPGQVPVEEFSIHNTSRSIANTLEEIRARTSTSWTLI